MVDYTLIANEDPGGTLEQAYATMVDRRVSVSRGVYKITDIMVAAEIGLSKAESFLSAVEAAVPARVSHWIKTGGIDINHPDTIATLTAINPPHLAEVLPMGSESVCPYGAGFKIGHLQNARQMRADGRI